MKSSRSRNNRSELAAIRKRLAQLPTPETKFITPIAYDSTVSNTGQFLLINGIPNGTTDNQRIGDVIKSKHLELNMEMINHASSTYSNLRVTLFYFRRPTGSTPIISDLFTSLTNVLSLQNVDLKPRFQILYDKHFTVNTYDPSKFLHIDMSLNAPVHYIENGSTISYISENALYMLVWTDRVTNLPTLRYVVRYGYTDD